MKILRDRNSCFLMVGNVVLLCVLLIFGYFVCEKQSQAVKEAMLQHDYRIAGYLLEQGIEPTEVAASFTAEKNQQQQKNGMQLLKSIGYDESLNDRFLPENKALKTYHQQLVFGGLKIFTVCFLSICLFYLRHQQKILRKAIDTIDTFMDGDFTVRIESEQEGDLYALFTCVNELATELRAHSEEEEHAKNFLKNTISDISHQIKTPLAAIKMYNEIIESEADQPDTIHKFVEKTSNALERMETLIQNLLKITRLDVGMILFEMKSESLFDIVEEIIFDFETRASQENKTIYAEGDKTIILFCDKEWMLEAISNLVKNALDHTKDGGQIHIIWNETAVITQIIVQDNGNGIHPEDIHYIFKRFYRSRFSQDTAGIGLGLSLAKSIIEAHNGTITANSELNKGSLFTLAFLKLTKK